MIRSRGVFTTFSQEEGTLLQKYRGRMGGVLRYFPTISRSGADSSRAQEVYKLSLSDKAICNEVQRGCCELVTFQMQAHNCSILATQLSNYNLRPVRAFALQL